MSTPPRDFLADLRVQLDFLRFSIERFDAGHEHEALRLATTLRVLLHARGGRPLLGELGLRDDIKWFSYAPRVNPANLMSTNGLVVSRVSYGADGAVGDFESKATAPHNPAAHRWIGFEEWWGGAVIVDPQAGKSFSRNDLVSMLASRDGGAHVGRLKPDEHRLAQNEYTPFAFAVNDEEPVAVASSPVRASMRTVADEVLISLERSGFTH